MFIVKPVCLSKIDESLTDDQIVEAIVFASYFVKKHMLMPGKVESWVIIQDLENTPFLEVPYMRLNQIG